MKNIKLIFSSTMHTNKKVFFKKLKINHLEVNIFFYYRRQFNHYLSTHALPYGKDTTAHLARCE